MGCEKLQRINELLKKELVSSEIISSTLLSNSNKKRLEQFKNIKGSIISDDQNNAFPDGLRLHKLV